MRWLLTSFGSFGDLHPMLALGRGLIARGHQVTLVGHPEWENDTVMAGLRFVSSGEPTREELMERHPEIMTVKWTGLGSLRALVDTMIAPSFDRFLEALRAEIPAHDVMLCQFFALAGPVAADLTGIPYATINLAPGLIPSAWSLPGAHFGKVRTDFVGRVVNRVIWTVGDHVTRIMIDSTLNDFRAKHGLSPARGVMFRAHSLTLKLQLYSEHFASRPPDWSAEKKIAGFCFFDPPGAVLPAEVEEFLGRGEPPVLFTLGTTAVRKPGDFYEDAATALKKLELRGLLLIGSESNRPANLPDSILAVPYAPFGLLMPRVSAVAHQCGMGTLSHALRSGVPAVACPFAFDQPNNARRLEALGVAEFVPPRYRDAVHLEEALKRLFAGEARTHAQRLGELIRAEDGVGKACAILEETFRRG